MLKMTVGFILGVIAGLIFGPPIAFVEPLGTLFLKLLKLIVVPIILLTLISAVNVIKPGKLGRVGIKIFIYYVLTTAVATLISLVVAILFSPGTGLSLPDEKVSVPEQPAFVEVFLNMIPANIFEAFANTNVLAVVFVALVFGLIISYMRDSKDDETSERGTLIYHFVKALEDATFRFLNGVLQYAPIGVFALIATTVGEQDFASLISLGTLTGTVYISVIIQIMIYSLLLFIFGIRPFAFFKKIRLATSTAFFTQSSTGTLPVTLKSAKIKEIEESVANFTLPIGATVNMDGAAIRLGASVVFAANMVGMDLQFSTLLGIIVTATLISIGTAGVPGAGIIGLSVVLSQFQLPLEAVALVAGIDVILGMAATACNVTGDLVGAGLVSQSEKNNGKQPDMEDRLNS